MNLLEALKKPFIKDEEIIKSPSSNTNPMNVSAELSDEYLGVVAFSNTNNEIESFGGFGDKTSPTHYQNQIIRKYRNLAENSDVDYAIDLLVNEMVFSLEDDILKINIENRSKKFKDKVTEKFNKLCSVVNVNENIDIICRQLYVDGQLNVALIYDKSQLKEGIKKVNILEPFNLYYDKKSKTWKFVKDEQNNLGLYDYNEKNFDEEYTNDELIHIDFKLYKNVILDEETSAKINLGYLEKALKYVNQLSTLENLLVPLRYSRSVSRRLFNIDVAELPPKKAKELMNQIRNEFKYKKTYDVEKGLIKNLNSTQPLVEDYWLSNRNGGRGTTVETMDEKGGLMDMEDISYTSKKLFTSLKIPSNRNPYLDDSADFSYETDSVSNEDMSFYLFVDKLRKPVASLFKRMLKRELIYSGDMSEQEWDKIEQDIKIEFSSKSIFLENMNRDLFLKGIGNFQDLKEEIGKVVSLETALKTTLGWSSENIDEELEKIRKEKSNPLYNNFYSDSEF